MGIEKIKEMGGFEFWYCIIIRPLRKRARAKRNGAEEKRRMGPKTACVSKFIKSSLFTLCFICNLYFIVSAIP